MREVLFAGFGIFCFTLGSYGGENRMWTSSDGARTFEARIREYSPETGQVTVIMTNGQALAFSAELLSPRDVEYVTEWKARGGQAMSSAGANESEVHAKVEKAKLQRLDGKRYRRAELEKTPEFYLFYYSASW